MQVIANNVALLSDNADVRKAIVDAFTPIQQHDAKGGMTLDITGTPVVVCHGKMSLADEKALRAKLRTDARFGNAKLSRTNNVKVRCEQYAIADTPAAYKTILAEKAAEKAAKDAAKVADAKPAVK